MELVAFDDVELDDAVFGDPLALTAGRMDEYYPHAAGHERRYV